MKFQNPSFKFFGTDGQTNKQTDKPKAICSPLFQSWGQKKEMKKKKIKKRQKGKRSIQNLNQMHNAKRA